ncbi:MAG: hypothetical protein ACP5RE_00125 [Candidatus Acidifodinimicrobium sp.]
MKLEILGESVNEFLDRKTVNFYVDFEKGEEVKLLDVKKELSGRYQDAFLVVNTLKNVFGQRRMKGTAQVYSNEKTARAVLPKYVLKKNGLIEDAKEKEKK